MRSLGVFLLGTALAVIVSAVLQHFLLPNFGQLVARVLATPPNNPEWYEIGPALRRSAAISVYIIDPLVGLTVGLFVGLFQRERPAIVAAGCLLPDFFQGLLSDHAKLWMGSPFGVLRFTFQHSLPFVAAIIVAMFCQHLISHRFRPDQADFA
jgi:hypothetical protein